ncbi:MAG TPA: HD domain-containing protein [Candidatus Mediterraneibacter intestinavium]|nr:HD domain-containing protein [Candidatus Mediterraneibacter intestinavium]
MDLDFGKAKQVFEEYLDGYDRENDKVKLKIIHTYGVVEQSRSLAERLKLSEEDTSLAMIIALLHDIGRFEQLKRFDSFEPATMDHAAYGVEVLFGEGMIRRFVADDTWDDIIRTAIAKHSDFILGGIGDERTLLHAKLIRDADKLDNCRVKLVDDLETFMGAPAAEVGAQRISPKVREDALAGRSIYSPDRKTLMDYWVSYLAYFYDLNFRESLDIVEENDFVRRISDRVPYTEPETRRTMEKLRRQLVIYVREGLKQL